MFNYLAIFALLACGTQAQKWYFGSCPNVEVTENFSLEKYLGTWYESEKYYELFEVGGKCMKSVWSVDSSGKISVLEQMIRKKSGEVVNGDNTVTFVGSETEAKFNLMTPGVPFGAPYWILETDYDTYSVILSCTNLGLMNMRFSWILTRDKIASESTLKKAYAVYDKYGLSKKFEEAEQTDCPDIF